MGINETHSLADLRFADGDIVISVGCDVRLSKLPSLKELSFIVEFRDENDELWFPGNIESAVKLLDSIPEDHSIAVITIAFFIRQPPPYDNACDQPWGLLERPLLSIASRAKNGLRLNIDCKIMEPRDYSGVEGTDEEQNEVSKCIKDCLDALWTTPSISLNYTVDETPI